MSPSRASVFRARRTFTASLRVTILPTCHYANGKQAVSAGPQGQHGGANRSTEPVLEEALRERSRRTIEQTDLPDELRTAAGDVVATLWKSPPGEVP